MIELVIPTALLVSVAVAAFAVLIFLLGMLEDE